MNKYRIESTWKLVVAVLCLALFVIGTGHVHAQENQKKKSTIRGAGIGALFGQAIGGDTESTVIGGVIGAGVGRVAGNKKEKEAQQQLQSSEAAPAPPPTPEPADALRDTIWELESISPPDRVPAFFSKVITFRGDGIVLTNTTDKDGKVMLSREEYHVVGDTLVVNRPEYTINAKFKVDGDQLILSASDFSAILRRLKAE